MPPAEDDILADVRRLFDEKESVPGLDNSSISNVTTQESQTTIDALKKDILDRAQKINNLLLKNNLQVKKEKLIKRTSAPLPDLIDKLKIYQGLIYSKNQEMMNVIDEFNELVILLLEFSNKLNEAVNMRTSRAKGGKRKCAITRRRHRKSIAKKPRASRRRL